MKIKMLFNAKAALGACGVAACLVAAQPCAAQSAVCVKLRLGALYAGFMGVCPAGGFCYHSDNFTAGFKRCIQLKDTVPPGARYTVTMSALAGSMDVPCTPDPADPYDPRKTNTVIYYARGTAPNVHCAR